MQDLHARLYEPDGGAVASYIPELAKADPACFGTAIAALTNGGCVCVPANAQSTANSWLNALTLNNNRAPAARKFSAGVELAVPLGDDSQDIFPDLDAALAAGVGFGETSLIQPRQRTANICADTRVESLSLAVTAFERVKQSSPHLTLTLLGNLLSSNH